MAKLPPKKSTPSTPSTTKQPTQKYLPTAITPKPDPCGAGSSGGKHSGFNWIELLDPGQPFYGNRCIEGMYRMLFDNRGLYRAYYSPRPMTGLALAAETAGGDSLCKELPMVIPMELILRSANQAAHSGLVKPHERPLVHLAAIVSPCGLLMSTDDTDDPAVAGPASWDKISFLRMFMLSKPLIKIKAFDVGMGNTLAAVLGQSYEQDDVDFDQVTRLATAVRLSDTKLASYWAGQITSTAWSAI